MKTLGEKIAEIKEGTKFNIPLVSMAGKISRVSDKAVQLGGGGVWIPKSQIVDFDEITGEMHLSLWIEKQLNEKPRTSSGAY
jgi:hypothetical protein